MSVVRIAETANEIEQQFHDNEKLASHLAQGLDRLGRGFGESNVELKLLLNSVSVHKQEQAHLLKQLEERAKAEEQPQTASQQLIHLQSRITELNHEYQHQCDQNTHLLQVLQQLKRQAQLTRSDNEALVAQNKKQQALLGTVDLYHEISKKHTNYTLKAQSTHQGWFQKEKKEVSELLNGAAQTVQQQRASVKYLQHEQANIRVAIEVCLSTKLKQSLSIKEDQLVKIEALQYQSEQLKQKLSQSAETLQLCNTLEQLNQFFVDHKQPPSITLSNERNAIIQQIGKFHKRFNLGILVTGLVARWRTMQTSLQSLEQRYEQLNEDRETLHAGYLHLEHGSNEDCDLVEFCTEDDWKHLVEQVKLLEQRVADNDRLVVSIGFKQRMQVKRFENLLAKIQQITRNSNNVAQDLLYKIQLNGQQVRREEQPPAPKSVQLPQRFLDKSDINNSMSSDVSILERMELGNQNGSDQQIVHLTDHLLGHNHDARRLAYYLIRKDIYFPLFGTQSDLQDALCVKEVSNLIDSFSQVRGRIIARALCEAEQQLLLQQELIETLSRSLQSSPAAPATLSSTHRLMAFAKYKSSQKIPQQKIQPNRKEQVPKPTPHDMRGSIQMIEALSLITRRRSQPSKGDIETEINEEERFESERQGGKAWIQSCNSKSLQQAPQRWDNYVQVQKNEALSEIIQKYRVLGNLQQLQRAKMHIPEVPGQLIKRSLITPLMISKSNLKPPGKRMPVQTERQSVDSKLTTRYVSLRRSLPQKPTTPTSLPLVNTFDVHRNSLLTSRVDDASLWHDAWKYAP